MGKTSQSFSAKDVSDEEQLNDLLERCGLTSDSPKDLAWLYPWWAKEFGPDLPPARHIVVAGEEDFSPSLCLAVRQAKFVVYMFNEQDCWFERLGELEEFASAAELKVYLKKLVDQYLLDWKRWMKTYRP